MYDSSMKTDTYPLRAVPPDLLWGGAGRLLRDLGLSMADIMRQSMKLGLLQPGAQLSPDPLKNLKPLSRAESRRCYQQPNREFDALEHHLARLAASAAPGRGN